MSETNSSQEPNIHAENNSVAVGNLSIGGNVQGNITIGNTTIYQYATEDDVPLTSEEIETGLTRFATFIPERAPILQKHFDSIAKKLRATLGADITILSAIMRAQREDEINRMKMMCMEVLDVSFRALCEGQNPPSYDVRSPFLGLFAFKPEDKDFFFGRDVLIQKLAKRIKQFPFLAITGASGSGKSSLVMAGLIPALEAKMTYLTPSSAPLYQLHTAKSNAEKDSILFVDQFEELFTLTSNTAEREEFVKELLETAKTNRVIITMRADFWGEVAEYKELRQLMLEHQELIAPMDTEELYEAVQKQAATVGLRLDPTLSESILEDVKGEPGAMPLLQHALWMLWKRRHGLWLTAEEYRAFGGIQNAIAATADEFYEKFSPENRERMRNVFVRLTRLDETGRAARDTRRRVNLSDLVYKNDTMEQTAEFIHELANSRLLITSSESLGDQEVEVAHEALIRNWERLRNWLDEDRLSLLVHEGIREAASGWVVSGKDNDLLEHRGGKLEDALHLAGNPRSSLSSHEMQYLETCKDYEMGFNKKVALLLSRFGLPSAALIVTVILGLLSYTLLGAWFGFVIPLYDLFGVWFGFVIPLCALFIVYKQDKYRIVESKQVLFSLLGGTIGYFVAAQVNPALITYGFASREMLIRLYGPVIETTVKGTLIYLFLSRIKIARPVDGIIYGAAVGAGFAIIQNYEYIAPYPELAVIVALARGFSTNLIHMAGAGLCGYFFIMSRLDKNRFTGVIKFLMALIIPSAVASAFNTIVSAGTFLTPAIILGLLGLTGLIIGIRYFIRQDQKWIENILQSNQQRLSASPLNNVQQISTAIQKLFGTIRASQIERLLILQARIGSLQKALQDADDPKIRSYIEEQLQTVSKKVRGTRGAISNYCWENVTRLIPEFSKLLAIKEESSDHA